MGLTRDSRGENRMYKLLGLTLLFLGATGAALATSAPEIDPGSAGSALAILAGCALMIRGRRR
jgi:hypothetical protein